MNWYQIFYWVSVADNVKSFFDIFSNIFTTLAIISFVAFWLVFISSRDPDYARESSDPKEKAYDRYWQNAIRKAFFWFLSLSLITWAGYVFIPSKKDALIIIAGGTVGKFITSDSSAKALPSEVARYLKEKITSEINELHAETASQKLEDLTKEQLIEMLKKKQVIDPKSQEASDGK